MAEVPAGLTSFQLEVAHLFFELPASKGFLLAGGAALVAQRLTDRPTQDLDFFTSPNQGNVIAARDAFEEAATIRGWPVRRVRDSATFCRMVVHGPQDLVVDLALDAPPSLPPTASVAGPTFEPEELAGRKVVALFDRAEARDFTDVYALVARYSKGRLLARAAELDPGFDIDVFCEMLATLARFTDRELPIESMHVPELRRFFADWAAELRS